MLPVINANVIRESLCFLLVNERDDALISDYHPENCFEIFFSNLLESQFLIISVTLLLDQVKLPLF